MTSIDEEKVKSPVTPEGEARGREAREESLREQAAAFRRQVALTSEVAALIKPRGAGETVPEDAVVKARALGRELLEQTSPHSRGKHHA